MNRSSSSSSSIISLALAVFALAIATTPVVAQPPYGITLITARAALQAALDRATHAFPTVQFSICILDPAMRMKAFVRTDDVPLIIHSIACNKARGALQLQTNTEVVGSWKYDQPDSLLYKFQELNSGFTTIPGGIVLKDVNGTIIGAIGASGSFNATNDVEVAQAGADSVYSGMTLSLSTPMITPPAKNPMTRDSLSLKEAMSRLETALGKALANPTTALAQALSVVDHFGQLVAYHVMDGVLPIAYDLSIGKALTAIKFNTNNKDLMANLTQPQGKYYTMDHATNEPWPIGTNHYLTALGGGILFYDSNHQTMGAVSGSGAFTDGPDMIVAGAGAEGVTQTTRKSVISLNAALGAMQAAMGAVAAFVSTPATKVCVVVLDVGGQLVASASSDGGVAAGAFDIARRKALAASFAPVTAYFGYIRPNMPAWSLQYTNGGMTLFSGGEQLMLNGQLLGTIGVWTDSFADTSIDNTAAAAAKTAFANSAMATVDNFVSGITPALMTGNSPSYAAELVTLGQATAMASAVFGAGTARNGAVAVRDGRGEVKFFARQDNAPFISVDLALKVSRQSFLFPYVSEKLQPYMEPGYGSIFTAELSNGGLVAIGGGTALVNNLGVAVGSVGYNTGAPSDPFYHAQTVGFANTAFMANGGGKAGVYETNVQNIDNSVNYRTAFILLVIVCIGLSTILIVNVCRTQCRSSQQSQGGHDVESAAYRQQH